MTAFYSSKFADVYSKKWQHSLLSFIQGGLWSCRQTVGAVWIGFCTFGLGFAKNYRCCNQDVFVVHEQSCMPEIAWIWKYLIYFSKNPDVAEKQLQYLERFKARWRTYTILYITRLNSTLWYLHKNGCYVVKARGLEVVYSQCMVTIVMVPGR